MTAADKVESINRLSVRIAKRRHERATIKVPKKADPEQGGRFCLAQYR